MFEVAGGWLVVDDVWKRNRMGGNREVARLAQLVKVLGCR